MWWRQSTPIPLVLVFDCSGGISPPAAKFLPPGVELHPADVDGDGFQLGGALANAVEVARHAHTLGPDDAILVIDDDDYYSPRHVEVTVAALERERVDWTGAQRIGFQWRPNQMPPEIVDSGWGPGQHAAWAYRLRLYDRAGGYREELGRTAGARSDVYLGQRMGWTRCATHRALTHVRRQFGYASISAPGMNFDRARLRASVPLLPSIQPAWRPELDALERWCLANQGG
jgi:hypothetical protein